MPGLSNLRISRNLAQYAEMLHNEETTFIADQVLPIAPVDSDTVQFYRFADGFAHAVTANFGLRTPRGKVDQLLLNVSQVTAGTLKEYALESPLDINEIQNADDNGLGLKQGAIALVMQTLKIVMEKAAAALLFSTSTFSQKTAALSGANQWSDSGSSPIAKSAEIGDTVRQQCGVPQDGQSLLIGAPVWKSLKSHPELVDRCKYTSEVGNLNKAQVAKLLGFRELLVGDAVEDTVQEGETESKADIWGKFGLIYVRKESPTPMGNHGVGFTAVRRDDGLTYDVREYDNPDGLVTNVLTRTKRVPLVTQTKCGYLLSTVVA
jgi:hypothetical protein